MKMIVLWAITIFAVAGVPISHAQQAQDKPGLIAYTPTRIEWLTLVLNSQLRQDETTENRFSLNVVQKDHETLLIFVRYLPTVDRESMNMRIDTAREVIKLTAKSYGWDRWLKVRESVEMYKPTTR